MVPAAAPGRLAFGLTLVAAIYGAALVLWVVAVPSIDGQTLLEYGGPLSLVILAQPLLVSGLFWMLLRRRCTTGSRSAIVAAWPLASLYLVYSVLGALSIAAAGLPAALALLFATALTPGGPPKGATP
jgi:hypothetical protein